jgi:hypothetical protein
MRERELGDAGCPAAVHVVIMRTIRKFGDAGGFI